MMKITDPHTGSLDARMIEMDKIDTERRNNASLFRIQSFMQRPHTPEGEGRDQRKGV